MSFDASRFSFHPWNDYLGVVMQQGRVQLDADWNEWVAELARRLQAGTMDTLGRAVVPRTTPEGFHVLAAGGALRIGVGRLYVDGLLAENHGAGPVQWDAGLAEPVGGAPVDFFKQPYLPFNGTAQPAPADVFDPPALNGGPHLAYLDVWQRELTHLQAPELVEKAVGVDTTGRLQTVWQVKLLQDIGDAGCATPDDELPSWAELTRPSGARLSTGTGEMTGTLDPCLAPPGAGYKGLENQLYRVEIHHGGPQAAATFKWSRDNATVAARVLEIHGGNRLVAESLGRDDVLGFHAGEWVEILDDWHELHGLPGRLHRIRPGDGVDAATRSILLEAALPAGLFPVDGQGRPDAARHTRVRRWDPSGSVRRADGSVYHDLDAAPVSDGIPVPAPGVRLALENGILVDFGLIAGGEFKPGDHWVFAARTSDGNIDTLDQAPPRGIHHHYARLAVVTLPDDETDCRVLWPPEVGGGSCDCTVCVHAETHNAGTATLQQAIDAVRARGGGTVCLDVGTYLLRAPLNLTNVRSLRLRGQGWSTVLQPTTAGGAIRIERGIGVTIENLSVVGLVSGDGTTAMIDVVHGADIHLARLTVAALARGDATATAIALSGVLLATSIRDCVLVAEKAVVAGGREPDYLFSANLSVAGNVLLARQRGLSLAGACLHHGQLRVADNLVLHCAQGGVVVTGAALPASSVTIEGNVLHVAGTGIVAAASPLRVAGNAVVGRAARTPSHGIELVAGFARGALDGAALVDNRLSNLAGHGIHIDTRLGHASVRGNVIQNLQGGALVMSAGAAADHLAVEGNRFADLGPDAGDRSLPYFGVLLLATRRADVTGNLFANVARQTVIAPLRAAIMALASGELRIAGNRMHGVGPSGQFSGRAAGIVLGPGFTEAAIDDNAIARAESGTEAPIPANWQALWIVGGFAARAAQDHAAMAVPGVMVLPTRAGHVYLARNAIVVFTGAGSVTVRGNRVRSQASLVPAVEVLAVQGCLFDQNDIRVSAGQGEGVLAGRILADHANLANNRLVGQDRDGGPPTGSNLQAIFELSVVENRYAVLGNLRSAPIVVNGVPDTALPMPWNTLNVAI